MAAQTPLSSRVNRLRRPDVKELSTGKPETQTDWHEAHRDMLNNMYRTSYQDMINGREVSVKNDFPAGYGGHIPSLRHDVLFRNTAIDKRYEELRTDFARDAMPSFREQNEGIPAFTERPRGARKPPSAYTVPTWPVRPWALTQPLTEQPTFRSSPPGTAKLFASRAMSTPRNTQRPNTAAMSAGFALASPSEGAVDLATPRIQSAVANAERNRTQQAMSEVEVLGDAYTGGRFGGPSDL